MPVKKTRKAFVLRVEEVEFGDLKAGDVFTLVDDTGDHTYPPYEHGRRWYLVEEVPDTPVDGMASVRVADGPWKEEYVLGSSGVKIAATSPEDAEEPATLTVEVTWEP